MMDNSEKAKENILNAVNKKLKRKKLTIAFLSCIVCVSVVSILYGLVFVKQTPIAADLFKDVRIETKRETINEVDNRELEYSHLVFTIDKDIFYSMGENAYYYVENNSDASSTLYFYMSENCMQKQKRKAEEPYYVNILLSPKLCRTEKINKVTKVCYLICDYDKLSQEKIEKVKDRAVVLWEK